MYDIWEKECIVENWCCIFLCDYIIGLEEEGIYRKPGIVSKATKLYKNAIEKGKVNSINLTNEEDWDTKSIASAVKGYLSKQIEEPLLTFALHSQFIECASKSCDSHVIYPKTTIQTLSFVLMQRLVIGKRG